VYPTHNSCSWIGEQNGPLFASVPFIWQAVSSFPGIPGADAFAVARYSEAVYVDVPVDVPECVTDVPLTPGALYAVVFVAVKAGVLTNFVMICSGPALREGVADVAADAAAFELVEEVVEASVAAAAADLDVDEAEEEDDEDAVIGKPSCQPMSQKLDSFGALKLISNTLVAHSLVVAQNRSQMHLCESSEVQRLCEGAPCWHN